MPVDEQWLKASEWKESFGDIVHLEMVGQHIIFLNKFEDAINLLEKRSNIYSERPVSEMCKLINLDRFVVMTPYGDKWRLLRRVLAQEFNKSGAAKKENIQERHAQYVISHSSRINIWSMSRDRDVYGPDPEVFRPERHFDLNVRDPVQIMFGFGRRICPGRILVQRSLEIEVASILHVFTISKALNEDGSEVSFVPVWVNGITVHSKPFPCSIKPRFSKAASLVDVYFENRTSP